MKFKTNRFTPTTWIHSVGEDCSAETAGDKTIQDDAMKPRDILERYANGMDIKRLQKFGIYDKPDTELNDEVLSAPFTDLTQIDQLIQKETELRQRIEQAKALKQKIEEHNQKKQTDTKPEPEPNPEPEPPAD